MYSKSLLIKYSKDDVLSVSNKIFNYSFKTAMIFGENKRVFSNRPRKQNLNSPLFSFRDVALVHATNLDNIDKTNFQDDKELMYFIAEANFSKQQLGS